MFTPYKFSFSENFWLYSFIFIDELYYYFCEFKRKQEISLGFCLG